jgi:tryptophan synthase alpha chain
VTGASARLAADLADSVQRVRAATPLPVAVGFGISNAQQAAAVGRLAEGVVVGSALVDALAAGGVPAVRRFLGELRAGLDRAPAVA